MFVGLRALLFVLITLATVHAQSELDLPVLSPDDPQRSGYTESEGHTPPPPAPPVEPLPAPPPVFFGEALPAADSIVYVLDFSQSMSDVHERVDYRTTLNRWQVAQREAARSISDLSRSFRFGVVVFGTNGGCGVSIWKSGLVPAVDAAKREAIAWIHKFADVRFMGGATPTAPAVLAALLLQPDVIALLTDGHPSRCGFDPGVVPWISHRVRIAEANVEPIPIHVFGIGMADSYARGFCMGVAGDSGGNFVEIR